MKFKPLVIYNLFLLMVLSCCGSKMSQNASENIAFLAESESAAPGDVMTQDPLGNFDADSAYSYVAKQVEFGPRVPNTESHRLAGDWLSSELRRHNVKVAEQKMQLKAFDGTVLNSRNIFGQLNPQAGNRILLLAHWDSRPWADQDPDPSKRREPVDGANDGASGVGILLEIARQLNLNPTQNGIDFLFVDAEDWGTEGDDDSWALGTKYFVENPIISGYSPQFAILLDMVGGEGAIFPREYYSERYASSVNDKFWTTARQLGFGEIFPDRMGSAVMDDHIQLIRAGIPSIDIIEYHPDGPSGFNQRWHTTSDNMSGISKQTLQAVGKTLIAFLRQ